MEHDLVDKVAKHGDAVLAIAVALSDEGEEDTHYTLTEAAKILACTPASLRNRVLGGSGGPRPLKTKTKTAPNFYTKKSILAYALSVNMNLTDRLHLL